MMLFIQSIFHLWVSQVDTTTIYSKLKASSIKTMHINVAFQFGEFLGNYWICRGI